MGRKSWELSALGAILANITALFHPKAASHPLCLQKASLGSPPSVVKCPLFQFKRITNGGEGKSPYSHEARWVARGHLSA